MKSHICYCAADGVIAAVRNRSNTAGARPPELVMGLPYELKLRLFANCEDTTPYPLDRFADVVSWSFEMDTDFSPKSAVKIVADNDGIRLEAVTENGVAYTQVTIPVSETHTAELEAALGDKACLVLNGELIGYDADSKQRFMLQIKGFNVYGRVSGLGRTTTVLSVFCDALVAADVNAVIASGGYVTGSGAAAIASGAAVSVVAPVSGGLQEQIDALSSGGATSGGITSAEAEQIAKQVALPKNSAWTTTVGGYTLSFDGNGGLTLSGSDATLAVANGSARLGLPESEMNIVINGGGITLSALSSVVSIDDMSVHIRELRDNSFDVTESGITANGSAITQVSSSFGGTSLGIAGLSGGVKYICQSALTALSIGSAAPGCNAAILFTLANGAVVTPPGNVPLFGVSAYTPGSRYVMAVNGDMAVVAEAVEV